MFSDQGICIPTVAAVAAVASACSFALVNNCNYSFDLLRISEEENLLGCLRSTRSLRRDLCKRMPRGLDVCSMHHRFISYLPAYIASPTFHINSQILFFSPRNTVAHLKISFRRIKSRKLESFTAIL